MNGLSMMGIVVLGVTACLFSSGYLAWFAANYIGFEIGGPSHFGVYCFFIGLHLLFVGLMFSAYERFLKK